MRETTVSRDQVMVWVHGCRREGPDGSGYVFSASASEPTIMALCFAILIMELYDALRDAPQHGWRHMLASVQDPTTGLFVDPVLSMEGPGAIGPERDLALCLTTYFALNALDAMDCRPRHTLYFVELFYDAAGLEKWLAGLDWPNPWEESNRVMFIAAALYAIWRWEHDRLALLALHHLLDWLDAHQDPETGFWGVQEGASLLHAMAGACHFLPFYLCLGRSIRYLERMIESTLFLQQSDGLFHPDGGGDACLDVDAVDILVKCSLVTSYLADEVEMALERAYYGLLDNQAAGGGFCRARHHPLPPKSWKRRLGEAFGLDRLLRKPYEPGREVWYYGGWEKMSFDIRQSDLWSTWFRSYGLAAISTPYPEKFPLDVDWRFRRLPALGWHDIVGIVRGYPNES